VRSVPSSRPVTPGARADEGVTAVLHRRRVSPIGIHVYRLQRQPERNGSGALVQASATTGGRTRRPCRRRSTTSTACTARTSARSSSSTSAQRRPLRLGLHGSCAAIERCPARDPRVYLCARYEAPARPVCIGGFADGTAAAGWSHCRFRKIGAEYVSESGMKRMGGSTKRQCDRILGTAAAGWSAESLLAVRVAQSLVCTVWICTIGG
jgi:hypothetical protein